MESEGWTIELHDIIGPVRPETVTLIEWESGTAPREALVRVSGLWVQFECKKHTELVVEISALYYRNADLVPKSPPTKVPDVGGEWKLEEEDMFYLPGPQEGVKGVGEKSEEVDEGIEGVDGYTWAHDMGVGWNVVEGEMVLNMSPRMQRWTLEECPIRER